MKHLHSRAIFEGGVAPACLDDTELREIASAMREMSICHENSGLHAILNRAHVGIVFRDAQSRVLVVNDAYCDLVGRTREDLNRLPIEAFTHPDDLERVSGVFREHAARAEAFEMETRYMRPDGTTVWCTVHLSFIGDADGRQQSTLLIASDITARKAAEMELRESEDHYRYTVELNPQIAWTAGPDGLILEVSPRWHAVTGVPQEAALGEQWLVTVHPDDAAATHARWLTSIATNCPVDVDYRLRTADGSFRWFRARAAARLDASGNVMRWYGTLEDIHDRRIAEDALRDSEERFRLAAEAAGLGIWDYDALAHQRQWSNEFKMMLGLRKDAVPSISTALDLVVPEDRHLLQALVDAAQSGNRRTRFEVTLRIRRANDGAERWMQTDGWRMHTSSGRLSRVLVTIRDVTKERMAADQIRWTARYDALTRIPNRAYFTEQLERAIQYAGPTERLALILFDVDHLKETNDTIGHDAGDILLRTFADRLTVAFGPDAITGRLGGDEFAVLLTGMERDEVCRLATQALQALRDPFTYDVHACDMQATAGASVFPMDACAAADLLKAADIALYAGKNGQRGTVSMFDPTMRATLQRRASMLNVARMTVRDHRIVPHYQPKVRLADRKIVGFEALLRWQHPDLGIQTPDTIAAAFDDMNLAVALSDAMLDRIAQDLRAWLDRGLEPGRIAINLSPAEFRHDQLVLRMLEPFRRRQIPLDSLEMEITETVLLGRNTEKIAATLAAFRQEGVTIALDDFGTGYASLTHLKAFPVDVIKIDRGFVGQLREGSDDAAIVDAIVGLAHRLRLEVVAEGIEDQVQADYLLRRGCALGQGYLFGPALSADSVQELLAASRACD